VATTQVPAYIPTDGLVASWPFNGNANDESGNGNHGLVTGATYTANRAGVSNHAILLDGTSDHITVANSANLQVTSLTLCGWINYAEASGIGEEGMQSILSKWYRIHSCDQESDTYIAVLSSQTSSVHLATASSVYHDAAITSDESIVEDEWVHFAYIHDENQGGKIFLNGIESGSNSTSGQICSATHVLLIGADSNLGSLWRFFDGKLDDLAIWNRALSPAEISIVYQGCSTLEFGVITGPISPITFTNSSYSISTPNPGSQYQWLVSNGILVSGQGTSQIEVLSSNTGIGTISVTETGVLN